MSTKYIFVSGGVISGAGKGITAASIALLLKSAGFKVAPIKCDPYLNLDAGTMNPVVHGEVFVTDDGMETDQDVGHYERFLGEDLSRFNYMTLGQVYDAVIRRERSLEYGGVCVEVIPHVPQEIIRRITDLGKKEKADFVIVEIGGTAGEFQNMMFLEADREMKLKDPNDILNIHVAYLPLPPSLGELKTKPVQTSVHFLNSAGIQPDIIVGRAEKMLDRVRKEKISIFCGVSMADVFSNPDVDLIYKVPLVLEEQGLTRRILEKLNLKKGKKNLTEWKKFLAKTEKVQKKVKIVLVGKYFTSGEFSLEDSYICVLEAVKHASFQLGFRPEISWVDAEEIEKKGVASLAGFDGIIVPQGWGSRGTEGKILAAQYARENKIPYLGLCFGMQMAVIEFARHVLGFTKANSTEVNPKTPYPVIHIMPRQEEYLKKGQYGGTIRLGLWPCKIYPKTKLYLAYSKSIKSPSIVNERHRHRFEFNNKYRLVFEKAGMIFSGNSPDRKLIEAIELSDHPFFLGTQFHPELKSRPLTPHPIFLAFIQACLGR